MTHVLPARTCALKPSTTSSEPWMLAAISTNLLTRPTTRPKSPQSRSCPSSRHCCPKKPCSVPGTIARCLTPMYPPPGDEHERRLSAPARRFHEARQRGRHCLEQPTSQRPFSRVAARSTRRVHRRSSGPNGPRHSTLVRRSHLRGRG